MIQAELSLQIRIDTGNVESDPVNSQSHLQFSGHGVLEHLVAQTALYFDNNHILLFPALLFASYIFKEIILTQNPI